VLRAASFKTRPANLALIALAPLLKSWPPHDAPGSAPAPAPGLIRDAAAVAALAVFTYGALVFALAL
jgi:hypothetical protein